MSKTDPWSFRLLPTVPGGRYEAETIDNGRLTRIYMSKDEVLAYLGRLMSATEAQSGHASGVESEG